MRSLIACSSWANQVQSSTGAGAMFCQDQDDQMADYDEWQGQHTPEHSGAGLRESQAARISSCTK
eukprot:2629917-Amphidinium_carterae.1